MKPILLLGTNFLRSQLLLIAIVLAYVTCLTGFLAFHLQLPDLLFFVRQQAIYAVALGAMVTVPALQNERKSRRIMCVLSKGIHRWQYLGGLLCGAVLVAGIFCVAVGLAAFWLGQHGSVPAAGLMKLMLVLFIASAAGASVALFCSVFLHPLLAVAATSIILFFPYVLEARGWHVPHQFFPVFAAIQAAVSFTFQRPARGLLVIGTGAVIQIIVFWIAASIVFARRDVAIAAE